VNLQTSTPTTLSTFNFPLQNLPAKLVKTPIMPPSEARKSTKESRAIGKIENIDSEDGIKLSASGRPVRKGAGKRPTDSNFVNSIDAIHDSIGDLVEENKKLISSSKSAKRKALAVFKRGRSPSPPPLVPIECPDVKAFAVQENDPAPEVIERTAMEPVNLVFHIPPGFQGPLKVQLDPETIARLATPCPLALSYSIPRSHKRQRLTDVDLSPKAIKKSHLPINVQRWVKKYGDKPRGFCDLPAGKLCYNVQVCFWLI
jgi:hypothetical protein